MFVPKWYSRTENFAYSKGFPSIFHQKLCNLYKNHSANHITFSGKCLENYKLELKEAKHELTKLKAGCLRSKILWLISQSFRAPYSHNHISKTCCTSDSWLSLLFPYPSLLFSPRSLWLWTTTQWALPERNPFLPMPSPLKLHRLMQPCPTKNLIHHVALTQWTPLYRQSFSTTTG